MNKQIQQVKIDLSKIIHRCRKKVDDVFRWSCGEPEMIRNNMGDHIADLKLIANQLEVVVHWLDTLLDTTKVIDTGVKNKEKK